jgi:hypothetical protein
MRTTMAFVVATFVLGCGSGHTAETSPETGGSSDCDGVWLVEANNWLKEQADVHYFDVYGHRTWLVIVYSDMTKTFSIASNSTRLIGKAPHVEVSSGREFWCSQRWRHSSPTPPPNSPNFKVTISCSAAAPGSP